MTHPLRASEIEVLPLPELKPAVVFVHGFLSSEATWEPLLNLLRQDPAVAPCFDFMCFGYLTKAVELKPHQRIPRISEAAKALREFLDSREFYDREITLVGHSQGGLIIQAYLADMLKNGQGERLSPIRQVITLATPSLGSTFLSSWRKLAGRFFSNPQEQALRVLDPYTAETLSFVAEHVVHAKKGTNNQWPIPFHVFYGTQDNIVLEASARGVFPDENLTPLDADHFTILKPRDRQDRRYAELVEALLDPSGHSSVYEVELYETKVSVQPALDKQEFACRHGDTTRVVHSDNIGCIDRSVTFSHKNRCTEPLFEIRYRTRHEGFLEPFTYPDANEASESEVGEYDDYGVATVFKFTPKPGKKFRSKIDVYGGFGKGQRDIHFHIGRNSYSKRRVYTLDLSGYRSAGYVISRTPSLHFHAHDPGDHGLCKARALGEPVPPDLVDERGIWQWEFSRIRQGVVDIVWDLNEPFTRAS